MATTTVGFTIHRPGNLAESVPKAGQEQACRLSFRRQKPCRLSAYASRRSRASAEELSLKFKPKRGLPVQAAIYFKHLHDCHPGVESSHIARKLPWTWPNFPTKYVEYSRIVLAVYQSWLEIIYGAVFVIRS